MENKTQRKHKERETNIYKEENKQYVKGKLWNMAICIATSAAQKHETNVYTTCLPQIDTLACKNRSQVCNYLERIKFRYEIVY